eukprot:1970741-Rhodomonas_salina.2
MPRQCHAGITHLQYHKAQAVKTKEQKYWGETRLSVSPWAMQYWQRWTVIVQHCFGSGTCVRKASVLVKQTSDLDPSDPRVGVNEK